MRFRDELFIHVARERAFDYRLDLRTLPDYNPDVLDVVQRDGAWELGLRLAPALRVRCVLTIVAAERPRRIEFAMRSLFEARETCTFEVVERDGKPMTRVSFEAVVDTPTGLVGALVDAAFVGPSLRRQVRRELRLMKRNLETPDR